MEFLVPTGSSIRATIYYTTQNNYFSSLFSLLRRVYRTKKERVPPTSFLSRSLRSSECRRNPPLSPRSRSSPRVVCRASYLLRNSRNLPVSVPRSFGKS